MGEVGCDRGSVGLLFGDGGPGGGGGKGGGGDGGVGGGRAGCVPEAPSTLANI